MDIKSLYQVKPNPNVPQINPGDTVRVSFKVKEAARERLQVFPGLVIKVKSGSDGGTFTIRKVASGVGVEHTFPFASPLLDKVEVVRHGKVRRAKLYYMRRLSTREARLKERREKLEKEGIIPDMVAPVIEDTPEAPLTQQVEAAKET
jgi:large subunit ribosomal protein L19